MNRFEQAIYDCMSPTAALLETTSKPLHRAMLLNFWRHVHLEGAGDYDRIVAPDMMVDEPVYRVTWGANPAVITGKEGVLAFYELRRGDQPSRVREIHRELLAKLEAERGDGFWILNDDA